MKTVDEMINDIIRREGGYVNDPDDRGGETNFGITQKVLDVVKPGKSVKDLTESQAAKIYRELYFTLPKINLLPSEVQSITFDMCVLHGRRGGIKILQKSINKMFSGSISVDGAIGSETVNKLNQLFMSNTINRVVNNIVDTRKLYIADIVAIDKSQVKFLKGWFNRCEEFRL